MSVCWISRVIAAVGFVGSLVAPMHLLASDRSPIPPADTGKLLNRALDYLHSCQRLDGGFGEHGKPSDGRLTRQAVLAIAAAGEDPGNWSQGGRTAFDFLPKISTADSVAARSFWAVVLRASGRDPTSEGEGSLLAEIASSVREGQLGDPRLLIDDFWGVMALSPYSEFASIVEGSALFIESRQNKGGGWSYALNVPSDGDDTSLAILALLAAGRTAQSPSVAQALAWLTTTQARTLRVPVPAGSVPGIALIAQAVTAAEKNPGDWQGLDLMAMLRSHRRANGSFGWTQRTQWEACWMTASAIPVLAGRTLPMSPPARFVERIRAGNTETPLVPVPLTARVWVRIEGSRERVWAGEVTVGRTSYTTTNRVQGFTTSPTVLGAGITALRQAEIPFTILGTYGDSIDTVDGRDKGSWYYRVNGVQSELCQVVHPVRDGDRVLIYAGGIDDRALRVGVPSDSGDLAATVEAYDVDAQSWLPAPTGVRLRVVREVAVGPEGHAPVPLGTRGGVAHLVATGEGYIRSAQIRVEIPAIVSEPPVAEASADLESGNGLGRWVGFGVLVLLVLGFIARRRQRR